MNKCLQHNHRSSVSCQHSPSLFFISSKSITFPRYFLLQPEKIQNLQLQRHPFYALWHTISHKSLTLILHFLLENGFK